jgi:hypothetical protein
MTKPNENIEFHEDSILFLECELEDLMRRMLEIDMNAILRIEQVLRKVKMQYVVERHFH